MGLHLPERLEVGCPKPLGAFSDGLGVNFAVFSANAAKIELCIFDSRGRVELARLPMPECTDEVWHGYLPDAGPGLLYGYRAYGPYDPKNGHRFNPHKLLIDPYARQLRGNVRWSDALFGYRVQHQKADLSMDRRDSAAWVPKCVVDQDEYNWGASRRPGTPWAQTYIYEAHVRGVSMRRSGVPSKALGTCQALAHPEFIDHLNKLGVTAIELMPLHAYLHDHFLVERGLRNYWGYNSLAYFAAEPAYLASGQPDELRRAIRRFHEAGIEVILDVVYNHTAEGNELGPTLSWRGLDNASYYRLIPGDERYYINDTGCGNTMNLSHPRVLQMVMDSLRYWAESFRVDGFRFDLGVTLGREGTGFDPGSGFFDALLQDPVLSRLKLISEPWDIGPDGYQLGNHPPGFAEWNDKFRDGVRQFWRGDAGLRSQLASCLLASPEMFDRRHRRPWASVNYLASHDGFTAWDVVSYNDKHNEANGDGNADGHSDNSSANWGVEGNTGDELVLELRERVLRAMLASTLLSNGTPMLLAGDEFANSQQGNNNAYCQDNELSWLDWEQAASARGREWTDFVARLHQLRRAHPSLHLARFEDADQDVVQGIKRVAWFDLDGEPMSEEAWGFAEGRVLGFRRAARVLPGRADLSLLLMNASADDIEFKLPAMACTWLCELDTADPGAAPATLSQPTVLVRGHSLLVLTSMVAEAANG
ncbi:glycogen debranching protein GlgX [Eoetvoesiella caeni]|uniref:Glycogen operon protein n=1 Tax=Eoetvoesiella caeni TaxID=645616 RepID=A0A366HJS1_9BURK|nr:glycogen debranching protein GlgX [Eoetvoesiella caeni]MCI2807386.1 glycogen debranching protein GlgX [Eoetvoesiella caeni]NYT53219.1 glycogen debranching protein GlgX [Eoetvoesiella caeni]RBP43199.1 glycogen operon protein [Eoetvoesiella caeni]